MELYAQSLSAIQVERGTRRLRPTHMIWMELGASIRDQERLDKSGMVRTQHIYPTAQGWFHHACRSVHVGIEWAYAIMVSEPHTPQVFALSLFSVGLIRGYTKTKIRTAATPLLVTAMTIDEARTLGFREAQARWRKEDGWESWKVKAWHLSADWFAQQMTEVIRYETIDIANMMLVSAA